jgi:hypothetical protein
LLNELLAEDPIAIPQQVPRRDVPREGFAHLLRHPLGRGMCRDRKVQDAPPAPPDIRGLLSSEPRSLGLEKDAPESRPIQPPESGRIVSIPVLGGLHHRYERRAA